MSHDPFNQLPLDAEWAKKVDEVVKRAADELGCFVLLAAAQENGKIVTTTANNDEEGKERPFYKMVESDIPFFLNTLAAFARMQESPRSPEDLN